MAPLPVSTWQFNFKFDEEYFFLWKYFSKDKINKDSLVLLKNAGISFAKFKKDGIDQEFFSEFMNSSGNFLFFMFLDIVLNDDIKWIAFHGGFDFAYFL